MNGTIFEVIVVGAGPAGLMCSYYLKHLGLEHVLFDQGRMGESWRSQRWNSFRMITPFQSSLLPGSLLKTRKPDAYGSAADMVGLLQEYVSAHQLPITEQAQVLSIEKSPGSPVFQLKVLHDNELVRTYDAWQVILAVGASNQPYIPPIAKALHPSTDQLHVAQYRSAELFKPGGVLVVGGGQSGLEVAYDLVCQGRRVWLSARPNVQLPRSYRGREIFQWLSEARLPERGGTAQPAPTITYPIDDDFVLDPETLGYRGVQRLGELANAKGQELSFMPWTSEEIERVRSESADLLRSIDVYIESQKAKKPVEDGTRTDAGHRESAERASGRNSAGVTDSTPRADSTPRTGNTPLTASSPLADSTPRIDSTPRTACTLDIFKEGISTIVWATGFTNSFEHIQTPLPFDQLMANLRGVTAMDGLYVVGAGGFAGSDYVASAKEDASFVTNRIYGVLR